MNKINILGINIDKITKQEVLSKIEGWLKSKRQYYIVTVNPEFIIKAQKDEEFKKILNNADIATSDGIGVRCAAKYLSLPTSQDFFIKLLQSLYHGLFKVGLNALFYEKKLDILPETITGVDLIFAIAKIIEDQNYSIYLLGGQNKVASEAALKLKEKFPNLKIAGAEKGIELQITNLSRVQSRDCKLQIDKKENQRLIERLSYAKPDILFVAFGHPKQEKWIAQNLSKLPSVKLAMGVGGAFDFISSKIKRAPKFMRLLGLEWLFRLLLEPWRIKRIFKATFQFCFQVIKYKLTHNE